MDYIKEFIVTVLIGAFIVNIVDMILPFSKLKPYINLVINFIFVFIVITPIISYFSNGNTLEDTILKLMTKYNKIYVDSINELANETNNEKLTKNYEEGLKEVLQLKLDEYGYEIDDIDINNSKIANIKIKKNSNNEDELNIKSNENENSKEVFSENIENNKLKDELVNILDISIEDIEIDWR